MKIWISKNSEVPVREQLIAQITLGIASGDFEVGEKLPSTREIARRCGIHPNTVSSAYQDLVEQTLLEFKKGSGFYVAESAIERIEVERQFELLVQGLLQSAKSLGFGERDVIDRIRSRPSANPSNRVVVVESDEGLREILVHELSARFSETTGLTLEDYISTGSLADSTLAVMLDEKPKIEPHLESGQRCVYLKGRSVSATMSGETRPAPDEIVAVVSGWEGFLSYARIMLLAANIEPGRLVIRSTADAGWNEATTAAAIIICDTLTASRLKTTDRVRSFQIISDESIDEIIGGTS